MYFVYVLKSLKTGRHYIGSTSDLARRLRYHNKGVTASTKHSVPWIIVYYEKVDTKKEALIREKKIKSYKGGEAFKRLIS